MCINLRQSSTRWRHLHGLQSGGTYDGLSEIACHALAVGPATYAVRWNTVVPNIAVRIESGQRRRRTSYAKVEGKRHDDLYKARKGIISLSLG